MDPKDDGLTDTEREVLAGLDDENDDDLDALRSVADDEGDDAGDEGDDGEAGDAAKASGQGQGAGDGASAGQGDGTGEGESLPAAKQMDSPIYTAQTPADAEAKLKEITQAKRQARRDYEEGTLDEDQYDAKIDELDQQRDSINRAITRAEVSAEMTSQQMVKSYTQTVDTFVADMKRAGIDYRDPKNAAQASFLNERVKALASTEHEQTPEGWRQLLEDAHALTARKFNIQTKPIAPAQDGKGQQGKPAPANRKPDLSGIPPTVGRGPGAANTSVAGDEFAHMEGLSGIALEREFSKMTPEQQDRYLL